jgi:hypothetical protein
VESRRFRDRYDRAAAATPDGLRPGTALRELVEAARRSSDPPRARVDWTDPRGNVRRVLAHAHDNRHAFLVLVHPAG